jgi:hypothetical protein
MNFDLMLLVLLGWLIAGVRGISPGGAAMVMCV